VRLGTSRGGRRSASRPLKTKAQKQVNVTWLDAICAHIMAAYENSCFMSIISKKEEK
jgi:hypothetical protein